MHVLVQAPVAADDEIPAILLTGNVLGFLLALAGECVLHAGAVKIDGSTIAIVGGSGVGKSTVTALLCSAGGCLISDDILRVAAGEISVTCFAGTAEIRLRDAATELAHLLPNAKTRWTADDRLAVAAPLCQAMELTVDRIVIPAPVREANRVEVQRLAPRDAVVALLRNPRVTGWHITEPVRRHFLAVTEVARIVPVFKAIIPWGPPFDPDLAAELIQAIA